jgi:hypothetical protein
VSLRRAAANEQCKISPASPTLGISAKTGTEEGKIVVEEKSSGPGSIRAPPQESKDAGESKMRDQMDLPVAIYLIDNGAEADSMERTLLSSRQPVPSLLADPKGNPFALQEDQAIQGLNDLANEFNGMISPASNEQEAERFRSSFEEMLPENCPGPGTTAMEGDSAVEGLMVLGFPRDRCMTALSMAGGDANLAANFLADGTV